MSEGLLEYFMSRQDALVGEINELVAIETPSHYLEGSLRIVKLLASKFREVADSVEIERADGAGSHIIARAGIDLDTSPTLILGHTDTVHPLGTIDRNPIRIEDSRLFGPGVFDMKGNIPLVLEALRYLSAVKIERPITVLLSCDEETGSATGRDLVEREAARSARCLVLEPSAAGAVKTSRKGTGVYCLEATGVPAHAGLEPERGANAVAELARQVDSIHAVADRNVGTTVNVTTFSGGTTTNVIPAFAACEIDVRFSNAAEGDRVEAELAALSAKDPRVKLELKGRINRPPLEETDDVMALYERARAAALGLGFELDHTQVGGASDGNFVAALGIPVLDGLGITGDGAHTLDEYIEIEDIPRRAALLTKLLIEE
ncbi:MAG TPA: M20 family metallopeptidase [Pyrinomonadaceae bacterium]|nr:M20 family metallopeptidase [Pyrinomonadaceae bacterium]